MSEDDFKKLVVGQEVLMVSGPYYGRIGKVAKVTEQFVEVELIYNHEGKPYPVRPSPVNRVRFDTKGKACSSGDINFENMGDVPGTHEYGPWELVDTEAAH